ncbi:DeoR/GlpR family DNA-binding transcription regulator [Agarilytica rhodophyticola]|uniref:DeoR/GlpR family DNA-binding transcription regulator n=1 Tax=Agarilytica rhodophyticola TaxID=1737490 RepID=UPI000B343381|nr:DeoR family transcriptional regulator [Agarilytica rhodophyticola]
MAKRFTQVRRGGIVTLLGEKGELSVDFLAQHFETSEVTIRKDLAELEANGLLLRRHGGAIPIPTEMVGATVHRDNNERKQALAAAAAELIRDHNRIIIDSGTTTAALLPLLQNKNGLVVMTNSLDVANKLRELENEPTILMTGGTWDARSESFQGQIAEQILTAYDFDQLFIGADGIDVQRGTTTYNELYNLSRVMADVAREVVVMAESGKINRKIHNLELPWSSVDVLVTDSDITAHDRNSIESHSVKVISAPYGQ